MNVSTLKTIILLEQKNVSIVPQICPGVLEYLLMKGTQIGNTSIMCND